MGCFTNLIALKGCGETAPPSGIYINDIGIDRKELAQYTTAQYATEEELFLSKYNLSLAEIQTLIHSKFQGNYKANSVLTNYRAGQYKENKNFISVANTHYNGIRVELCNNHSYLDYFVSELSLFTAFTGNIDVKVFDLIQGKEIDSIPVTGVANEIVTVYPYRIYKSDRKKLHLFFGYSETTTASDSSIIPDCGSCGYNYFRSEFVNIYGGRIATGDAKIKSSFDSTGRTYGMSIVGSLNCNHTDWLCSIGNLIALPLAYLTGAKIMNHAVNTSPNERANTNITINHKLLKQREIEYGAKYEEMINNVIQNMKLPSDRNCYECHGKVKYVVDHL